MPLDLNKPQLSIKVGHAGPKTTVEFSDDDFATHMAVYGGTGKGKSKLLELIIRQLIEQRAGVCVIDPHGDLVEDLMAYVMEKYGNATDNRVWKRIHYLEPGSNAARFRFDPFRYNELHGESYDDWLKAKVESVARTIIRKQGEAGFEGKPRLERFLTNVLYACGTRINEQGDHLGLGDALVLLDSSDGLPNDVYSQIAPHLPSEVRADFDKVRKCNPRQQEDWMESTINRLRSFLSPAVKSLFAGSAEETFDFRSVIDQQTVLLVNLRRTRSFTIDQGNAIGGLVINEILEAAQLAARTARRPFYLFIDEASRFVGQDLIDALAQFRKMKLSLCLAVQDLSSLKLRDIDMTSKVISQCGIHVTFQQKNPEDLDVLGQLFGYPLIDFAPLHHEVDRPDGYEWVGTESETTGTSTSESSSESRTEGTSTSNSFSKTEGTSAGESISRTEGTSRNARSDINSKTESLSRADSTSQSKSTSRGESTGQHEARTLGYSSGKGQSHSITRGKTPLAKYRTEIQATGRLNRSVSDQIDAIKQMLRMLQKGQAVVSVDGTKPFCLNVHTVNPPFPSLNEERRLKLVDGYKAFLGKHHPYCFHPGKQDHETARLRAFLKHEKLQPGETDFGI